MTFTNIIYLDAHSKNYKSIKIKTNSTIQTGIMCRLDSNLEIIVELFARVRLTWAN